MKLILKTPQKKKKAKGKRIAIASTHETDVKAAHYEALSRDLNRLGFVIQATHLVVLFDSIYRQTPRLGIRTPKPEFVGLSPKDPTSKTGYFSSQMPNISVLSFNAILAEMEKLAALRKIVFQHSTNERLELEIDHPHVLKKQMIIRQLSQLFLLSKMLATP